MNTPDILYWRGFIPAIVIGAAYIWLLFKYGKNNKKLTKFLVLSEIMIFMVNCLADFYAITQIAHDNQINYFSAFVLSVFHSLELFVFQTHFFDNGYQEFFFGDENHDASTFFVYVFSLTFVLACITSSALIVRTISRRRAGRAWLQANKENAGISHIFFLGSEISMTLARNIQETHPEFLRIFVGYPDPEESYVDLSIWEKIKRLVKARTQENLGPFNAIVYSRIPLSAASGNDICAQMNLRDLDAYLKNNHCKVYLLSDSEEENLHCAEILYRDGCVAEIFCRACREGVNRMYEDAMTKTPSMNVHLIDSSFLAVRNIISRTELLPVNFVDKGTDNNGLMEGWVSSEFNSIILGFGETGREALGFLYEYGAFVNRDYVKSPFSCMVMDRRMRQLENDYCKSFPGMNKAAGVTFNECEIGGNEFWKIIEGKMERLNYIIVCLGDDRLNLKIAVDLVEYAFRHGKDLSKNFTILIDQENPTHLDRVTLDHYNSIGQYHNCIRTFGNNADVWTYDNMTNDKEKALAKNYFGGYMRASGDTRDPDALWEKRELEIENTPDFAIHAKRVRQRSQDYANCFHVSTKLALIGPEIFKNRKEISSCIPPVYEDNPTHYTGTDKHVETVLRYLAVHEHIRWEASHIALGYTPGTRTDEVMKTHECIKNYDDLSPHVQHYDYLVVKTTFEIAQ